MNISRRRFLFLTTGAATLAATDCGALAASPEQLIDAGPVGRYAAEGVYSDFRDLGFFLVRRDGKLSALSSFCTHRKCKLKPEPDRSFYCKCHGSTFTPTGHVTQGPAKRDLPTLATSVSASGHLLVQVPAT